MKSYLCFFFFITIQLHTLHIFCIAPVKGLGKTHFISGYNHHKKSRQQRKKRKEKKEKKQDIKALFSPHDDVCKTLCDLISNEKKEIKIAIYTLTDPTICQTLIDAHKRGISIEIITEKKMVFERYSLINELVENGITVYIYQTKNNKRGIMHNKFVLFSQNNLDPANNFNHKVVWVGSFNFTKSGGQFNRESVILVQVDTIYTKFLQEFTQIKQLSKQYITT